MSYCHVFLSLPPDNVVDKCLVFSVYPSAAFIRLFRQILLPWYLMNGLSSLIETYMVYPLTPTDDLIRFWRSKVKLTAGHRGGCWSAFTEFCSERFFLSHSVLVFSFSLFFISVPCARLSWPSRHNSYHVISTSVLGRVVNLVSVCVW